MLGCKGLGTTVLHSCAQVSELLRDVFYLYLGNKHIKCHTGTELKYGSKQQSLCYIDVSVHWQACRNMWTSFSGSLSFFMLPTRGATSYIFHCLLCKVSVPYAQAVTFSHFCPWRSHTYNDIGEQLTPTSHVQKIYSSKNAPFPPPHPHPHPSFHQTFFFNSLTPRGD